MRKHDRKDGVDKFVKVWFSWTVLLFGFIALCK